MVDIRYPCCELRVCTAPNHNDAVHNNIITGRLEALQLQLPIKEWVESTQYMYAGGGGEVDRPTHMYMYTM